MLRLSSALLCSALALAACDSKSTLPKDGPGSSNASGSAENSDTAGDPGISGDRGKPGDPATSGESEVAGGAALDDITSSEGVAILPVDPETRFMRKVADEQGERVEMAIAHFERADGVRVDLVAEVHIAEPEHYRAVQAQLENYDAVLFELVADPADLPGPGEEARPSGILSWIQGAIGSSMKMGFQLEELDYSRDNFVHADFTPEEFAQAMEDGGETPWTMVLKVLGSGASSAELADAGFQFEPIDFVEAARAGKIAFALRRQLSQVLLQMNVVGNALSGTVLLDGRNRKALEVLQQQLELGKRSVAIHYGAAHMTGISEALTTDLGFRRTGTSWIKAWSLDETPEPTPITDR